MRLWQLELRGTWPAARPGHQACLPGTAILLVAPPFFAGMLLTVLIAMVGTVGTGGGDQVAGHRLARPAGGPATTRLEWA